MADTHNHSPDDPLSDPEEQRVFRAALDSFRHYRRATFYNTTHLRRQSFYSLSTEDMERLSAPPFSLPDHFREVDDAIETNSCLADLIYKHGLAMFDLPDTALPTTSQPSSPDMVKAHSTLKQLFRDWSAEGEPERNASYLPILAALDKHFPTNKHHCRILIPGTGLGRLLFDLVHAGYTATGTEISYHQMIASAFILNGTTEANQHILYPWVTNFSNHLTRNDQLTSIRIPDIHPAVALDASSADIIPTSADDRTHWSERMSMTSGDFCVVYSDSSVTETFDALVTCFFIDTAPNLVKYIKAIHNCLIPGGIWINHGPLQWHFENTPTPTPSSDQSNKAEGDEMEDLGIAEPGKFELTDEDVKVLVGNCGFEILEERITPAAGYIQNPKSMLQTFYRPSFWVARKKIVPAAASTTA